VTLRAKLVTSGNVRGRATPRVALITLAYAQFGPARGDFVLTLRLNATAEAYLRRHHDRAAVQVLIASRGARVRSVDAVLTQKHTS
jgi:hypothetical protein